MRHTSIFPDYDGQLMVVGLGGIGSHLVPQLVHMGFHGVHVVDHDKVEAVNVGNQNYSYEQVGLFKTFAMSNTAASILPYGEDEDVVLCHTYRWRPRLHKPNVVFVCVDNIDTRRRIFECWGTDVDLLIDARLIGEQMEVFTVNHRMPNSYSHYESSLFDSEEAYQTPGTCTAPQTYNCGAMCAGFMAHQFSRYLRDMDTQNEMRLSLLTEEFVINNSGTASLAT